MGIFFFGILTDGICREEDKRIYNRIVYKKKVYIFLCFFIIFFKRVFYT